MRIFSSVLFFLGLVSVNAETCPFPEEIEPCRCHKRKVTGDVVITCEDKTTTFGELKKALASLSQKENVEISLDSIKLGRIPSDFFKGIGVKILGIYDCELDSLQGEDGRPALLGLEDTLEDLTIIESFKEENVPTKLNLGHLRKLIHIDLYFNTINELGDDWFDNGPASLKSLSLSYNGIKEVGERAFANLINLQMLLLYGIRFSPLKRSMLPSSAESLDILELNDNDLTSLPEDIFSGMPSLKRVSFSSNKIEQLDQRTWQPVWQRLDKIELQENPLVCDSRMEWMFDLKVTSDIHGECEKPSEKRGLSLKEFIDKRGY